jgi:hypothetical protein
MASPRPSLAIEICVELLASDRRFRSCSRVTSAAPAAARRGPACSSWRAPPCAGSPATRTARWRPRWPCPPPAAAPSPCAAPHTRIRSEASSRRHSKRVSEPSEHNIRPHTHLFVCSVAMARSNRSRPRPCRRRCSATAMRSMWPSVCTHQGQRQRAARERSTVAPSTAGHGGAPRCAETGCSRERRRRACQRPAPACCACPQQPPHEREQLQRQTRAASRPGCGCSSLRLHGLLHQTLAEAVALGETPAGSEQ